MKTALLTLTVPRAGTATAAAGQRFVIARVPPLLAVLGIGVGVGLGAFASGAEFGPGAPWAGAGRAAEVEVLPRVVVTPHGVEGSESAAGSESCNRLHC